MQHKITKLSRHVLYSKVCEEYTLEINGKRVRVDTYDIQDNELNQYDGGQDINEADLKVLTEEEQEVLEGNLTDALEISIDGSIEVEGWDN